jgi:endo-1,4-beta-xylanase
VTTWGLDDGQSWLNNWPIEGRTNHALLFDRNLDPKANYARVIEVAGD